MMRTPIRPLVPLVALLVALLLPGAAGAATFHPLFPLLDADGNRVLDSGDAVSPTRTCGSCHDAAFIEGHSFHVSLGADGAAAASGRPWDRGRGRLGRWDPLTYRNLSAPGSTLPDLGLADWIRAEGAFHVGGGPASGRDALANPPAPGGAFDPARDSVDSTGAVSVWDWNASGTVEMNCFLCHIPNPDNPARVAALADGKFRWAATATLDRTGVVEAADGGWRWNRDAFDADGNIDPERLHVQDPTNAACGQCHGLVQVGTAPLVLRECRPDWITTMTTGQIFSPQRLDESGMNLAGKASLDRSWDVHAERLVDCVDCHHAVNNPIYRRESNETRPEHLRFDARRMDFGEYLRRPDHDFAKGRSLHPSPEESPDATMRRCESCHDPAAGHAWLPYRERHFAELACESCHVPKLNAPARRQIDWTLVMPDGEPVSACRGLEGKIGEVSALVTGYTPVLLSRREVDGRTRLAPYNLITSWFWTAGEPEAPVPLRALKAAFLDGAGGWHPELVAKLDVNFDGTLETDELVLDTPEKVSAAKARLEAVGVASPRIRGEIQPWPISHSIVTGDDATRDCRTCHGDDSRLAEPFLLASAIPGGVMPTLVGDAGAILSGRVDVQGGGRLVYTPRTTEAGLFVFGHDSERWITVVGILSVILVAVGAGVHGFLRWLAVRRRRGAPHVEPPMYLYSIYERLWHWLQALAIFLLILTGIEIHYPDRLHLFGFAASVRVHNVIAFVVVVNAALAAFYHLASGQIRQFLPEPKGFFGQAIVQARYYLGGIFRHERHPFEKHAGRKLNPLQQVTYLVILNVLLPLQVLSGLAMWGLQERPEIAERLGGLSLLAPIHTLGAWLFAAFLLMHLYLTTTGSSPTASVKAMIHGWEGDPPPALPVSEVTRHE